MTGSKVASTLGNDGPLDVDVAVLAFRRRLLSEYINLTMINIDVIRQCTMCEAWKTREFVKANYY